MIDATGSAVGMLAGERRGLDPWEVSLADRLSRTVGHEDVDRYEVAIEVMQDRGIRVCTVLDQDYPLNLRMAYNRPPALFVKGILPDSRRMVALVGTRQPSAQGRLRTAEIAEALVASGAVVVSGLARGIDTCSHRATLSAGGMTIAVMGTGIGRVYPPENEQLAAEIVEQGALVSQFWPDTPPTRHTFPVRNSVLSGLSAGVVVVEGSARSGSSMQARIAFEQGRPVFVLEGLSAEESWVRGFLARGLGQVVRTADDVLESVGCLTQPIDRVIVS
jgi:DNA processing protein